MIGLLIALGISQAALPVNPVAERLGRDRGHFGFPQQGRRTIEDYMADPYVANYQIFETPVMLFPAGRADRRYLYKFYTSLSMMERDGPHLRKRWYGLLTERSDMPQMSGVGTLDRWLQKLHVEKRFATHSMQKSLDARQAFAAYCYSAMGTLYYNFVTPDGLHGETYTVGEDWKDINMPPGKGRPYPITKEEIDWLASH